MTMTTIDVTTIEPLTHAEAMRRQAQELDCTLALLRSLDDAAWAAATDCPAWDIRAMYQHVLGACEAGASDPREPPPAAASPRLPQAARRAARSRTVGRAGTRACGPQSRPDPPAAHGIAPKTVRGRARTPALVRHHAKLAVDGPVHETWRLGYLIDTIYLRDLWMHRIDAARALGRTPELSAGPRRPHRRRHRR